MGVIASANDYSCCPARSKSRNITTVLSLGLTSFDGHVGGVGAVGVVVFGGAYGDVAIVFHSVVCAS
jgi:hypothetical protein